VKIPASLACWWLTDPATPRLIGTLYLLAGNRQCAFQYKPHWRKPLSPGLPLQDRPHLPLSGFEMPGVFEDAGPDRWGKLVIERLDRPERLSPIDYLYLAGDQRLGCLGFSTSETAYEPPPSESIPGLGSIDELYEAILRIEAGEKIEERHRRLLNPGRTFGGARPKASLTIDGEPWIVKFPQTGDTTDSPLIEYATLQLARLCGLERVVDARPIAVRNRHALAVRRFDRERARRLHAMSARTLIAESEGSGNRYGYDSLADALRRYAPAKQFQGECEELFRRMVFNILIDNTDDHEKNHVLLVGDAGLGLSPVFDVSPQLTNLGSQAMMVGRFGVDSTVDNALSAYVRFALTKTRAQEIISEVRAGLKKWRKTFVDAGVKSVELEAVAVSLERAR
jgi:serine/threonine-protein kinase HipA